MASDGNFSTTYQCGNCGENVDAVEDTPATLIQSAGCPHCGDEDAMMKAVERLQRTPVEMDTVPEDRREELFNLVGKDFSYRENPFTLESFRMTKERVDGVTTETTSAVLDYHDEGTAGRMSIDDFSSCLKAGTIKPLDGD